MPLSDRDGFITLLDRLGSPDDAVALASAREIDSRLKRDGLTWDAVLVRAGAANDDEDDAPGHVHALAEDAAPAAAGDTAADLATIERLLAGKELSADTREILQDLKDDIKSGSFAEADRRYIRSLEIRLGAAKKK
jgi:hypothetical protein